MKRGNPSDIFTTERMEYYPNGQLHWVEDANGHRTTYEYDGHDRRKKFRYPNPTNGASSSTTDYDLYTYKPGTSLLESHRRRSGLILTYSYDSLGRLKWRSAPGDDEDIRSIGYNIYNQVRFVESRTSLTINDYDVLGRLETTSTTGAGTVGYQYDAAGRRTRMDYPGTGLYVTYAYDDGGQLEEIRENGATSGVGVLAHYDYDQLGRRLNQSQKATSVARAAAERKLRASLS
ncbi:MAG: hypothetical protein AAF228_03880 [Pseudomonadota bacterium]